MLFVWPILFTTLVILYFSPFEFSLSGFNHVFNLNIGFVLSVIYGSFYICLDFKVGVLGGLMCFVCWVSDFVAAHLGFSLAWKVVLVSQLIGWTGQFIGHGVYEKRDPALLDNLPQAFVMGPFFVLLETLQMYFGYEPNPGFHAGVNAKIQYEIKE